MLLDWMHCFDLLGFSWSFINGWYVNNQSGYSCSVLHLLPCQSGLCGEADSAKKSWGGVKAFHLCPMWDSGRSVHAVAARPVLYPQSTCQWHSDSKRLAPGLQSAPSKPSVQQNGGNTTASGPQLIIKSLQPQRAQHLHLNVRLPSEASV